MNRWNTGDIPPQDGRLVVITGVNGGFGGRMTEQLLSRGDRAAGSVERDEKRRLI